MDVDQAAALPANRTVIGLMVGIDDKWRGAVVKFRLLDRHTETAFFASPYVAKMIEALELWNQAHPELDCGNLGNGREVQQWPRPILDNSPTLFKEDWDAKAHAATPFLHLFDNTVVLVVTLRNGKSRGYTLNPGAIWTLRSVVVPHGPRFLDVSAISPAGGA